jgi:hypothetical protein
MITTVSDNPFASTPYWGDLPDSRVLTPDDAQFANLHAIAARWFKIDQRIWDARRHVRGVHAEVDDHLELLALAAAAARAALYRRATEIRYALQAGSTWRQVADATGLTVDQARAELEEWSRGPVAQKAGELDPRSLQETERYLRAGDDEVVTPQE